MTSPFFLVFLFSCLLTQNVDANPNYIEALFKSLPFFQGQRSGYLPTDQQLSWRDSSGLSDGSLANVDLTGGYYDAGDNVKFNFPMAFTTTMLSWSTLEYGAQMGPHFQNVSRVNIRWATDYLLKCATATPGKLYVGVGDPNADHKCWERPEGMDTLRTVYSVSSSNPGSDVAAETAAALAAASMVFREVDSEYSLLLLATAKNMMEFAIKYRGNYSDSLSSSVCPFYCSYSGYKDELMWGAAWLLKATDELSYENFIKSLGGGDRTDIFNWDNKYAGAYLLLSQRALVNNDSNFEQYKKEAEFRLQDPPKLSLFIYPLHSRNSVIVNPDTLISLSKQQVDYILGENPIKMSYMVGFGSSFPMRIHHRASSLPSQVLLSKPFNCTEGFQFYHTQNPNPNILTGAIVGGPDKNDEYPDKRDNYIHSEPATYINAPFVGPLAYFASRGSA
ncbi:hypothetical protein F2Q69_00020504 [Brassica cretica]|uniref:Endoglucanase n=1 Tax=Brassica cretica TaxID=69181 RepID=A0A8S9QHR2_BRACR|nr:hypothetical protein F2Q69_00020504 [Brassica cretica]